MSSAPKTSTTARSTLAAAAMAGSTKRKRSAIACVACHQRKVRCNLATQGPPCTNCSEDGNVTCRVYGSRAPPNVPQQPAPPAPPPISPVMPSPSSSSQHLPGRGDEHSSPDAEPDPGPSSKRQYRPTSIENLLCTAHDPTYAHGTPNAPVLYYIGESAGMALLFDVCYPSRPLPGNFYIIQRQRRYFPPAHITSPLMARPLPEPAALHDMISCYFRYLHPYLPVIDAGRFISAFASQPSSISPLLLWSVLFAAATFVKPEHWQATEFRTRKEYQEDIYRHAKALYDSQIEVDKPTIIQACILLSYHLVDREDLDGPCHWIGVATGLAQSIGFHRKPTCERVQSSPFSQSQCNIWARIWWSLYSREVWLGLGFGRPLRINSEDCDLPMPEPAAVLNDIDSLPATLRETFIPREFKTLVPLWIELLKLAVELETILRLNFRPGQPPASLAALESHYRTLQAIQSKVCVDLTGETPLLLLHRSVLKIYHGTVLIALHRPYLIPSKQSSTTPLEPSNIQSLAMDRYTTAASAITKAVNDLVRADLLNVSPPTLPTCINSAIGVHLHEACRSEGIGRQLALHNVNLHMLVLSHLGKIYCSAEIQYRFFLQIMKTAEPLPSAQSRRTSRRGSCSHAGTAAVGHLQASEPQDAARETSAYDVVTPVSTQPASRDYQDAVHGQKPCNSEGDALLGDANIDHDFFLPSTLFNIDSTPFSEEEMDFYKQWGLTNL
ncbi:cutinase transcription factor 1 beta [Colletotrichum scovillei]|uniref:Cutinase transcription factor 1 beta n=1 Tax=Colletotrichum scovillei TaxID=1209932 RepID=A0A9P7R6F7_9PEZI|nr:cutinase transcription factor 1 beta [Colletotrichum scovillei]KAG7070095.1 cutinase transcription factor 1 beta [Colletotrichum scovillei]KAG7078343.1 cutinase transcription factor 1 beta [Colletotrichum scovillei]